MSEEEANETRRHLVEEFREKIVQTHGDHRCLPSFEIAHGRIPEECFDDEDIVWELKDWEWFCFGLISQRLRSDRDFVMKMVTFHGSSLSFADGSLAADREIVMAAVGQDGNVLRHAHTDLHADREIVMAAVRQNGYALRYAHSDFHSDREVVMAAVKSHGGALRHAHVDLKADLEIVMAAVTNNFHVYVDCELPVEALSEPAIVAAALRGASIHGLIYQVQPPVSLRSRVDTFLTANDSCCQEWIDEYSQLALRGGVDVTACLGFVEETWKKQCRFKLFAIDQALAQNEIPTSTDWKKLIIEFAGIPEEFRLSNELLQLTPIFAAITELDGASWEQVRGTRR